MCKAARAGWFGFSWILLGRQPQILSVMPTGASVKPVPASTDETEVRATVIASLVFLAACGGSASPSPTTHALSGTLSLMADIDPGATSDRPCTGIGGRDDIAGGAQVTVKDGDGIVVATTHLAAGQFQSSPKACMFDFEASVPLTESYSVEVSHLGGLAYSRAELESAGWHVEVALGGS